MDKHLKILLTITIVFALSGILALLFLPYSPLSIKFGPKVISKPVPVKINTVQGKIIQMDSNMITVLKKDKVFNYPSGSIIDVQKIIAGSVEEGNATTIKAEKSDLMIGQIVFIISDKNLNSIRTIYIVR